MVGTLTQFIRRHWPFLLIALVLNGLVATNSILHNARVGYDVPDYFHYMRALTTHFPTAAETVEFFTPPLPFALPTLVYRVCLERHHPGCEMIAGKTAQVLNIFLSLGITFLLFKIAEMLKPGSESFKAILLGLLAVLTVYYKTFSQARAEPYVAFFITLALFLVLRLLLRLPDISWKDGLVLGLTLGASLLSRQWSFLLFPALGVLALLVLLRNARSGWRLVRILGIAGITAALVGGWFFLYLYLTYGSFTAFNIQSPGFSFANKPASFYTATGLEDNLLFSHPVRPKMDNSLFPIFYSETWGDYWGYFTFIRPGQKHFATNGPAVIPFLGRVNLVSIFPSLALLAGAIFGGVQFVRAFRRKTVDPPTIFYAFAFAGLVSTWVGYLWFLIGYPGDNTGDTNKATYLIQIFILLPILSAALADRLKTWKPAAFYGLAAGLLLVFAHNLPALITRYIR